MWQYFVAIWWRLDQPWCKHTTWTHIRFYFKHGHQPVLDLRLQAQSLDVSNLSKLTPVSSNFRKMQVLWHHKDIAIPKFWVSFPCMEPVTFTRRIRSHSGSAHAQRKLFSGQSSSSLLWTWRRLVLMIHMDPSSSPPLPPQHMLRTIGELGYNKDWNCWVRTWATFKLGFSTDGDLYAVEPSPPSNLCSRSLECSCNTRGGSSPTFVHLC